MSIVHTLSRVHQIWDNVGESNISAIIDKLLTNAEELSTVADRASHIRTMRQLLARLETQFLNECEDEDVVENLTDYLNKIREELLNI